MKFSLKTTSFQPSKRWLRQTKKKGSLEKQWLAKYWALTSQIVLRALHLWPQFFSLSHPYGVCNVNISVLSNLLGQSPRTHVQQSQDLSPGWYDPPVRHQDLCCYPLIQGMSSASRKHKNCLGSPLVHLRLPEEQPRRAFPIASSRDPRLHPPRY